MALLKDADVQNEIKKASAKYGVDPTAVAGAIVAENSLNVGVKDSVQTFLAGKMGITKIAGKDFSFGLGQINITAARDAEAHIAKIENRSPRSEDELIKEIADPMGSLRVASMIVRQVQDDYKEQGFDISKDPALLSTLYNLGESKRRAKDAKDNGRTPKSNYFGLFVEKYAPEIRDVAKIGPAAKVKVATAPVPPVAPEPPVTVRAVETARAPADLPVAPAKNLVKTNVVTKSLPLAAAPYFCDTAQNGDVRTEAMTSTFGAPVGVLEKNEAFKEVARSLDCKSNIWKLVRGSENKTGWVSSDQLEKAASAQMEPAIKCSAGKSESGCKQNIQKMAANNYIDSKKSDGLVYLKPISATPDKPVSFKQEDNRCGYVQPETDESAKKGTRSGNAMSVSPSSMSSDEAEVSAKELLQLADVELGRMSKAVNIDPADLSEPENPYSNVAGILKAAKSTAKECSKAFQSEAGMCHQLNTYLNIVKNVVTAVEYKKDPSLEDIAKFETDMNNQMNSSGRRGSDYVMFGAYDPKPNELESITPEQIKESLDDCKGRLAQVKENLPVVAETPPDPNNQNPARANTRSNRAMGYGTVGGMGMGMRSARNYGNGVTVTSDMVFDAAQKATTEQIKAHASQFMKYAKICQARLNMLSENPSRDNKLNCTMAPKYVQTQAKLFTREVASKIFKQNPQLLIAELNESAPMTFENNVITDILGTTKTAQPFPEAMEEVQGGYCPNKTAEFIEEMIKANPCIKAVYVPTKYLAGKLNSLGSKIIYRQFEDDGKYAVDLGDGTCK